MKSRRRPSFRIARNITLAVLAAAVPIAAQPPVQQEASAADLDSSIRTLALQIEKMNATILELRSELARSREEAREIRDELRRALEKLEGAAPAPEAAADDRLARLEENQQLLSAKIEEQHQTKVESASRYRVKLSGLVLLNAFANSGRVDSRETPTRALRGDASYSGARFGAGVRQSDIGFEAYGPELAGSRVGANLRFDFFGGSEGTYGAGSVRLKTAAVRFDWDRTSIVVGQDVLFMSPLSPSSLSSVAFPALSYSGNLYAWVPQARVEHRMNASDLDSISIQGGFLYPVANEPPYGVSAAAPVEAQRQPAYAARLAWAHGDPSRPLTVGISAHYGRQSYGPGRAQTGWSGATDWSIPLGSRVGISGEFYRGKALGGLGGGQGRSVLFTGSESDPYSEIVGVNAVGGWAQMKFRASESVEFNGAYGMDNPFSRDVGRYAPQGGYAIPSRNQSRMVNVIFRPRTDLLFSMEYRRLNTRSASGETAAADHVNLGVGVLF